MYIDGKPVKSTDPRPVQLPYDGSEVGTIHQATKEQVAAAIAAAVTRKADRWSRWRDKSFGDALSRVGAGDASFS